MILKFIEFINEAKAKDKKVIIDLLFKLLEDKPKVKLDSKSYPDEKDAYSLAGIKNYFKEHGLTSGDADDAFYYLEQDKERKSKVKHFGAKNFNYDQNVPYNYIGLTDDQVEKLKSRIEAESKELAKPEIEKREANKKRLAVANKERETKKAEKKTTEKKTTTKKK